MRVASIILAVTTGALVSLGLLAMFSSEIEIGWQTLAGQQVLICLAGLWVTAVMAWFDYRWLRWAAWPAFVTALALLVVVLFWGVKGDSHRAMRWLDLGWGPPFQPSEFAKLALVLVLAWYGDRYQRWMPTWWRGFVIPGAMVAAVLVLLLLQPDFGMTIMMAAVAGAVLLVAGVRWSHLLPTAVIGAALFAALVALDPAGRIDRVRDWWNPVPGSPGRDQVVEGMRALGSGGVLGRGPGQGEYYGRVPLYWSDFILAMIGEELGLVGTLSVVMAFALFVWAGVHIAWHARDTFGLLMASGLTFCVGLQAMINIGVVIDLLPNTGIALPFLSKGGSSLLVMLTMVGILFSIARITARERIAEADSVGEVDDFEALPAT